MAGVVILLTVSVAVLCISAQNLPETCSEVTFQNNLVHIKEATRQHYVTITGCISAEKIVYKNLKTITVSNQTIPTLFKGAVLNIPNLFDLQFQNNNIEGIKSHAFLNINVNSISLHRNGIKWIERYAFDNLSSLDLIDLDHNNLETLHKNTFVNLPNLTFISFSHNKLNSFDHDWFSNTPKLDYLFINNNRIKNIPENAFSKFNKLEGITLEDNLIEYIHEKAFSGLERLDELHLNNNKLKYLNTDFNDAKSLRFLSIYENELTYLPLDKFNLNEKSLKTIWVHANPWKCSCFNEMGQWTAKRGIELWWKCENVDLFCYVPKVNPDVCQNATDRELDSNFLQFHINHCDKIVLKDDF